MIIDATDFNDREYKVPNQEESRDFISFIETAEEELAIKYLLGAELWQDFQDGLASSGTIDPIWLALKDGADYEYGGKSYRFNGWVDLVKPGIYADWIPLGTQKFTNIGWIENSAPQQSKLIDDQYSFHVTYWNKFVAKVGGYKNSFYGFMRSNEDDYEGWLFNCPQAKNRFDL
jgi:hypothetical protein